MGLFKEVKKPVIRSVASGGGEISPLRPRFAPKAPPCASACPNGSENPRVDGNHRASQRLRLDSRTGFRNASGIGSWNATLFPRSRAESVRTPAKTACKPQRQGWASGVQRNRTHDRRFRDCQQAEALAARGSTARGKSCRHWRWPGWLVLRLSTGSARIPGHGFSKP